MTGVSSTQAIRQAFLAACKSANVKLHIRPIKSHRFVCPESQQSAEHQPFVGAVFGLSQWQFVAGRGRPAGLGDT
jgi:hypothetical protein